MAGCCSAGSSIGCTSKTLLLQDFGCLERGVSRLYASSSSSSHSWGYSHKPRGFVTQSKLQISRFSRGVGLLMKLPQLAWNIPMCSPSVEGLTEKQTLTHKVFVLAFWRFVIRFVISFFQTVTIIIPDSNCSHLNLCTRLACLQISSIRRDSILLYFLIFFVSAKLDFRSLLRWEIVDSLNVDLIYFSCLNEKFEILSVFREKWSTKACVVFFTGSGSHCIHSKRRPDKHCD